MKGKTRVCFVCLGNICRSPTAEAVMRSLVARAGLAGTIEIASAGTGAWHVGERPDDRATAAARLRGYRVEGRGRQFQAEDFARFEYVVAMDRENREALRTLAPSAEAADQVRLLRSYDPRSPQDAEVPDPYYGGSNGFDVVLDICEAACAGLLADLRNRDDSA